MDTIQARIAQMLRDELAQLGQLESVLLKEHELLAGQESEALLSNAKEKQLLIGQIEARGQERLKLLQLHGVGTDKDAVVGYMDSAPQLQGLWQEMENVLHRCQKQNQVNGVMLEKGRRQTEQLLAILLGEGRSKGTQLYNAKGAATSSFSNGRSVKV
jgi:flagellar biosynthesis/type III secretory pathway chaperone